MEYPEFSPDMSYSQVKHRVFDCDHHFYETAESFTRHLPKEYANAVKMVQVNGRTKMAVRGRISNYIPNPTFEVVAEPGSGMEYFANKNPTGKSFREIVKPMKAIPEFTSPEARMGLIDRMHIDAILNFPTLASIIEVSFMDDPDMTQALIHSFNQWMYEEWGFNVGDRIFTTPVINLSNCDGAIKELEWALERGAKTVLVRPGPVASYRATTSPFMPALDGFWARIQDADIPVMFHSSDSGYQPYANDWLGRGNDEFLPFEMDVFSIMSKNFRPIMDTLFAAVGHGMLTRFPKVKIATIECGSTWMPRLLEDMDMAYGRQPNAFTEHPRDTLRRQLYVAPFWEDPLQPLIDEIGLDHVLFSSDWPHPEGLADPVGYVNFCHEEGIADDAIAKIMGDNMYDLMGV